MLYPRTWRGKLFDAHFNLQCQNNNTINGRLIDFLRQLSNYHWMFLLLDMVKFTRFMWQSCKQDKIWNYNWELSNLHLHGSCYYDSSSLGKWGNGYHVNTCIMYYNMSCFVGSLKFSFISQVGVAMKLVAFM